MQETKHSYRFLHLKLDTCGSDIKHESLLHVYLDTFLLCCYFPTVSHKDIKNLIVM